MSLYQQWLDAKQAEADAVAKRREIEDALVKQFSISETLDGTESREVEGFKVKIVGRMARKVDADMLQELAAEHGLTDHLGRLFRWKPDINATAWKAADSTITNPLLGAITTTPSRPSFTITKE